MQKSTLINGIIHEVPALSGTDVSLHGRVALVPQTPFILNSTLRDNITFGLPFERDLYDRVIHVCCLRQDIDQLGEAKDLTQIGERGVTLSGGKDCDFWAQLIVTPLLKHIVGGHRTKAACEFGSRGVLSTRCRST